MSTQQDIKSVRLFRLSTALLIMALICGAIGVTCLTISLDGNWLMSGIVFVAAGVVLVFAFLYFDGRSKQVSHGTLLAMLGTFALLAVIASPYFSLYQTINHLFYGALVALGR